MNTFIYLYNKAKEGNTANQSLPERNKESITKEICQLLKADSSDTEQDFMEFAALPELRDALFYDDALRNTHHNDLYIDAVTELIYICREKVAKITPFTEFEKWIQALGLVQYLLKLQHTDHDYDFLFAKQKDRISAIRRLQKHGIRVSIERNKLKLEKLHLIYSKIHTIIEGIGGARTAELLLSRLHFNQKHKRFDMPRNSDLLGMQTPSPEPPIAYLLNLAFNKLSFKGNKNKDHDINHAILLATDLCIADYAAQSYTIWEDVFYKNMRLGEYLQKSIIWDTLYNIPQSSPTFILQLMTHLIQSAESVSYKMSDDYMLAEYLRLMGYLITNVALSNRFARVHINDIPVSLGISKEALTAIFIDISANPINAGYYSPLDYTKIKAFFTSAFRISPNEILLYPASIGALGWYEVFATQLRKHNKESDDFIGLRLESFLKNELSKKGISSIAGKYNVDNEEGECDVVVQNDKTLVLMELKKKALTRVAKEGHLFQIILDIAEALFAPLEQSLRTEAFLVKYNHIDLDNDGTPECLSWDDRHIERLAVSLNEFGVLHERFMVMNIMKIFMRHEFIVDKDDIADFNQNAQKTKQAIRGFKKLKDYQDAVNRYIGIILEKGNEKNAHDILFNSWFFTLEQLCYILSLSDGLDDFLKKLNKTKYIIHSTKDFWAEIDFKLGMQQ